MNYDYIINKLKERGYYYLIFNDKISFNINIFSISRVYKNTILLCYNNKRERCTDYNAACKKLILLIKNYIKQKSVNIKFEQLNFNDEIYLNLQNIEVSTDATKIVLQSYFFEAHYNKLHILSVNHYSSLNIIFNNEFNSINSEILSKIKFLVRNKHKTLRTVTEYIYNFYNKDYCINTYTKDIIYSDNEIIPYGIELIDEENSIYTLFSILNSYIKCELLKKLTKEDLSNCDNLYIHRFLNNYSLGSIKDDLFTKFNINNNHLIQLQTLFLTTMPKDLQTRKEI